MLRTALTQHIISPPAQSSKKRKREDQSAQSKEKRRKEKLDKGKPIILETQEEKVAMSIDKHNEDLKVWIDHLASNIEVERTTKKIRQTLQLLDKASKLLIPRLSTDLLLELMRLLVVQVVHGTSFRKKHHHHRQHMNLPM